MEIRDLTSEQSVLQQYLFELREVETQKDSMRFRKNLKRAGAIIAYEISRELTYEQKEISTPLENCKINCISDDVVIIGVLRAALPLHEGILSVFDRAANGYISAYRKHRPDGSFDIEANYVACPDIDGKVVILNDPMLATGRSMVTAWNVLSRYGQPKHLHLVSVIGSAEGVKYVRGQVKLSNCTLWCAAVDPVLNSRKYIVPGLGDAGDLAFGTKLQA